MLVTRLASSRKMFKIQLFALVLPPPTPTMLLITRSLYHVIMLWLCITIVTFSTIERTRAFNLIDNPPLSAVVVTCSLLSIPTNGRRSSSRRNYNDRVSFSCNTGYNLRGSSSRTCQSTGQWSGTQPTCNGKRSHIKLCHYNSIHGCFFWFTTIECTGFPTLLVLHCHMLCDQFYNFTTSVWQRLAVVSHLTLTDILQWLAGLKGEPNRN